MHAFRDLALFLCFAAVAVAQPTPVITNAPVQANKATGAIGGNAFTLEAYRAINGFDSATNLTTGTLPDGRFPSTLPALSGVNLTSLNASALDSGTVANARLDADLQAWADVNPASYSTTAQIVAGYQPLAGLLTSWAGVSRASGFDTFAAAPSSANLLALLTTKTGTGSAAFSISPTFTTPILGAATATSITGGAAADLTLRGGSSGASMILGQGGLGAVEITANGNAGGAVSELIDLFAFLNAPTSDNTYGTRAMLDLYNGNTGHNNAIGAHLAELRINPDNSQTYTARLSGGYSYLLAEGAPGSAASDGRAHYFVNKIIGATNITDGSGLYLEGSMQAGSTGRFENFRYIDIRPFSHSGALGVIPDRVYGLHIRDLTGAGTITRGILQEGDVANVFQGPVSTGALSTSSTIISTGTTDATSASTGTLQVDGGGSFDKSVWVEKQVRFPTGTSDNSVGLAFGSSLYLYRWGGSGFRFDGGNLNFNGDMIPVTTASYDLGTTGNRWRQLFAGASTLGAITSTSTYTSTNTTAATSKDAGVVIIDGGIGAEKGMAFGNGTGSASARASGLLYQSTTAVGNVTTGVDDLITQAIAASTLAANGDRLRITAIVSLAANANSKRIIALYGATTGYDSTAQTANAGTLWIEIIVTRTGAATQNISTRVNSSNSSFDDTAGFTTSTETLSGSVTFKLTGEGVATDDIIQRSLLIEYLPAS